VFRFLFLIIDVLFFMISGYAILEYSGRFFAENLLAFKKIWYFFIFYKVFFLYFYDLYDLEKKHDLFFILFKSVQSSLSSVLMIVFTTYYLRNHALPRSFIIYVSVLDILYISITRYLISSRIRFSRLLIVSDDQEEFEFLKKELSMFNPGAEISREKKDYTKIKEKIKNKTVSEIIFTSGVFEDFNFVVRLLWYASRNNVKLVLFPDIPDSFVAKIDFADINGLPLINIGRNGLKLWQRMIKRCFDIVVALPVSIILLPIIPIIAFFIKYSSEGPTFYKQERIGYKGKKFNLIKFRTMINNAEADTGPKLADIDDKRITKVGKFLRKYRIDELPQFFNVLIGNMSIVGPRPEREIFVKKYYTQLPGYFIRTLVKPGITGLAQIFGGYYTKPTEKLKFDFIYSNNYSVFLDLKVLVLTFFQMFRAKGV